MRLVEEDPEIVHASDTDVNDRTALHDASCKGHVEVVTYLLEQGADIDKISGLGGTALPASFVLFSGPLGGGTSTTFMGSRSYPRPW